MPGGSGSRLSRLVPVCMSACNRAAENHKRNTVGSNTDRKATERHERKNDKTRTEWENATKKA